MCIRDRHSAIRCLALTGGVQWPCATRDLFGVCFLQSRSSTTGTIPDRASSSHCRYVYLRRFSALTLEHVTLIFDPMTLKIPSAVPAHMVNICVEFRWNLASNWWEIALRQVGVNDRTGDLETTLSEYYCWRRHKKAKQAINQHV